MEKAIIPGQGAAGIRLGETQQEVTSKLGEPKNQSQTETGVIKMEYESVTVWIGGEGRVDQIGLYKGYEGKTEDGIGIGTARKELKKLWGYDLAYHEDDGYWEFISRPGTLFEFEKDEKSEEFVSAIYISQYVNGN